MHDWITVTTKFGNSLREPTEADMHTALAELFSSADDEHPDTWMECGSENGPLYCVSIFGSGYAIYTKYSDVDMTQELETRRISPVNLDSALELWKDLATGNLQEI
jgi:hypothetical protein